jgi:hypothetical protein
VGGAGNGVSREGAELNGRDAKWIFVRCVGRDGNSFNGVFTTEHTEHTEYGIEDGASVSNCEPTVSQGD